MIEKKLKANKTKFIPVDSEHFSIWYLLQNKEIQTVDEIIITASGGPFLNWNLKKLKKLLQILQSNIQIGLWEKKSL